MEKNRVGKPKIIIPKEFINEILHLFLSEKKISGLISYMDVLRYSDELQEKGLLEELRLKYKETIINEHKINGNLQLKEHFWRKDDGKRAIDEANEILQYQVPGGAGDNEKVVNTSDAIDKYFSGKESDKSKLLGALQINETKLNRYIKENKKLKERNEKFEKVIDEQKEKIANLQSRSVSFEQILFSWLDASLDSETPLINLMTTGKSRHPIVELLFQKMFSDDPLAGYQSFEHFRSRNQKEKAEMSSSNIVHLEKKRSVLDDIKI